MTDYGIKVSQDGYDVKTATVLQQAFNSEKNSFKISATGTLFLTGVNYGNVEHGLLVTPGWFCWFDVDYDGDWRQVYSNLPTYIQGTPALSVYSDDTYVHFDCGLEAKEHIMRVFYIIFVDPGD